MKKLLKSAIMAVAVIAVAGFASCNNDNDNPDGTNTGTGHKATLNIVLDNPSMDSRAAGAAPTTDRTINNFSVFVIDTHGFATWKTHVTGSGPLTNFPVTTDAKSVYVIANAGDQTENYDSADQLEAAKIDLAPMYDVARFATGNSIADLEFALVGNVWTANETLTLRFIASRITVRVDNQMENYTGIPGSNTVVLNSVAVMNARGQSKLFPGAGASLIPSYDANKKYFEGIANPEGSATPFVNYPATTEYAEDFTRLVTPYTNAATPEKSSYYFYVYENDALTAEAFPTIVTVAATSSDNTTPVYFPAHLAPYETWITPGTFPAGGLLRGNSYDVTITLTGDASVDGGGGTEDPTVPVINAVVNVTISITNWTPVPLEKEF